MSGEEFEESAYADIEAEQAVLGAAMLSPNAAGVVLEQLRTEHFYRPAHQIVHEVISWMYGRGDPCDPIAVKGVLEDRKQFTVMGGGPYLHTLVQHAPVAGGVEYYIKRLVGKQTQRALSSASLTLRGIADSPGLEREDRIDAAWRAMERATGTDTATPMQSVADLVYPVLDLLESGSDSRGVTTGWTDLDRLIPRLKPGQLITVGARPGMGKSVVMANLAFHVGVELGLPVFLGTLEMGREELMLRFYARAGKVDLSRLENPDALTDDDWDRLRRAQKILSTAETLIIDDEPGMGVPYLRSRLRAMRRAGTPAALVVVDYLQLMQSAGKATESRQVEVGQFSRSLKLLAKEMAVPVVIGSQLNRNVEQRANKRPTCADLRESGSVEQDSDIVILLYREDAYESDSPRAGELDLIVDKNRSGPKGTATVAWQGHYARAADLARPDWTPTGALGGGQ
jgi:replicative DNA helicase